MIPSIDRFMGAFQGICAESGMEGEEALEIAENILANDGFVVKDIETIVKEYTGSGAHGAAPLWRAIPVGLFYFKELDKLRETAEKGCRLTHGDPADIAAAVGMALSVARLLRLQELSPLPFVREIAWFIRKIDQDAYESIMGMMPPLRGEESFAPGDMAKPLGIFRAALFLFLTTPAEKLETTAATLEVTGSAALSLAYSLSGSFGLLCRLEKPSIRIVMIAEGFQKMCTE